jgi:hypothetical protein
MLIHFQYFIQIEFESDVWFLDWNQIFSISSNWMLIHFQYFIQIEFESDVWFMDLEFSEGSFEIRYVVRGLESDTGAFSLFHRFETGRLLWIRDVVYGLEPDTDAFSLFHRTGIWIRYMVHGLKPDADAFALFHPNRIWIRYGGSWIETRFSLFPWAGIWVRYVVQGLKPDTDAFSLFQQTGSWIWNQIFDAVSLFHQTGSWIWNQILMQFHCFIKLEGSFDVWSMHRNRIPMHLHYFIKLWHQISIKKALDFTWYIWLSSPRLQKLWFCHVSPKCFAPVLRPHTFSRHLERDPSRRSCSQSMDRMRDFSRVHGTRRGFRSTHSLVYEDLRSILRMGPCICLLQIKCHGSNPRPHTWCNLFSRGCLKFHARCSSMRKDP